MATVDAAHQVGDMQKCGAFQTNVDERGLHARQHPCYFPQINIADQTAFKRSLNLQLLDSGVLHHGNTGLLRRPVNQDFLLHGYQKLGARFLCRQLAAAWPFPIAGVP